MHDRVEKELDAVERFDKFLDDMGWGENAHMLRMEAMIKALHLEDLDLEASASFLLAFHTPDSPSGLSIMSGTTLEVCIELNKETARIEVYFLNVDKHSNAPMKIVGEVTFTEDVEDGELIDLDVEVNRLVLLLSSGHEVKSESFVIKFSSY